MGKSGLKRILDNKGESLIYVFALMMFLIIICISMAVAATASLSHVIRQREYNYASVLSSSVHDNIMFSLQHMTEPVRPSPLDPDYAIKILEYEAALDDFMTTLNWQLANELHQARVSCGTAHTAGHRCLDDIDLTVTIPGVDLTDVEVRLHFREQNVTEHSAISASYTPEPRPTHCYLVPHMCTYCHECHECGVDCDDTIFPDGCDEGCEDLEWDCDDWVACHAIFPCPVHCEPPGFCPDDLAGTLYYHCECDGSCSLVEGMTVLGVENTYTRISQRFPSEDTITAIMEVDVTVNTGGRSITSRATYKYMGKLTDGPNPEPGNLLSQDNHANRISRPEADVMTDVDWEIISPAHRYEMNGEYWFDGVLREVWDGGVMKEPFIEGGVLRGTGFVTVPSLTVMNFNNVDAGYGEWRLESYERVDVWN